MKNQQSRFINPDKKPPIRIQAVNYLKSSIKECGQVGSPILSLPTHMNQITQSSQLDLSFEAFKRERSKLGKLINEDLINRESDLMNQNLDRQIQASLSYSPPKYPVNLPLVKQKISLSVRPSIETHLIKKNRVHFFQRGARVNSICSAFPENVIQNSQINKNEQYEYQDRVTTNLKQNTVQDYQDYIPLNLAQPQFNPFTLASPIVNNIQTKTLQSLISKQSHEILTPLFQNTNIQQSSYGVDDMKTKRLNALMDRLRYERKAVDLILNRGQSHNGYLVNVEQDEELMINYFKLNMDDLLKKQHWREFKQVKQEKLPRMQLTSPNKLLPPPIGYYQVPQNQKVKGALITKEKITKVKVNRSKQSQIYEQLQQLLEAKNEYEILKLDVNA